MDRVNGRLLIYPPADPNGATVELSTFAAAMVTMENVSNVRFEGLTWELGSADAIHLQGGTNCLFAGCTVRHFAGNGMEIRGGLNHGVLSCDIYSMGRGGVTMSGGNRKTLSPGGHFLENCDIHDLSRIDHTYTPALILDGVGNRVRHNRLHGLGRVLLRLGGLERRHHKLVQTDGWQIAGGAWRIDQAAGIGNAPNAFALAGWNKEGARRPWSGGRRTSRSSRCRWRKWWAGRALS